MSECPACGYVRKNPRHEMIEQEQEWAAVCAERERPLRAEIERLVRERDALRDKLRALAGIEADPQ